MIVSKNLSVPLVRSENIQNKALLEERVEDLRKGDCIRVQQAVETLVEFQTSNYTKLRRLDASEGAPFPDVRDKMTGIAINILKDPTSDPFRKSAAFRIITVSILEGVQEVSGAMLCSLLRLLNEGRMQEEAERILSKIFADSDLTTISRITNQIINAIKHWSNANDGAFRTRINNAIKMAENARRDRFSALRMEL